MLKLAPATAHLPCSANRHSKIDEEDEYDEADQLPAAKESSFSIWHKAAEHDEAVGAD